MMDGMESRGLTTLLLCLFALMSCEGYYTDPVEPSVAESVCNLVGCERDGMVLMDGIWGPRPGCEPSCEGFSCGDDGCGGSCGTCLAGHNCFFGRCLPQECDDGNDTLWDECTLGIEAEFQVNFNCLGNQLYPAATAASNGSYLLAWHGENIDFEGSGVAVRKVNATAPQGEAEEIINQYTTGNQEHVALASHAVGLAVAVWQSEEQDGWGSGIFGRILTDTPAAAGDEFQVNKYASERQTSPAVASNGKGSFVVAWQSWWQDKDGWGIFARLFNSTGVALTDDIQVNSEAWGDQINPAVATLPEGGFVVIFESWDGGGWNSIILGRLHAADGVPAGEAFLISRPAAGFAEQPAMVTLADGRLLAAWTWRPDEDYTMREIQAVVLDHTLFPTGAVLEFDIASAGEQVAPSVAAGSTGFVVAWQDNSGLDGSGHGLFARRYGLDGSLNGTTLSLNLYTPGNQDHPVVWLGPSEALQAAWMGDGQDGDGWGILTRTP